MELDLMFWGGLTIFFIMLELATTALVAVWFVFGSLAAFGLAMAGVDFMPQCYVFTLTSVVVFGLTRPFVKRVKPVKVPTNADQIIGMEGITLSVIDNVRIEGRVLVNGLDWRAMSSDGTEIPSKTVIVVDRLEGVTVYVSRKS
ncbi:MAG: NfeD family protein [Thermoguttaceae bacterium]|nr:NfeD family protein [Thermoguttaceae bacterium]